MICLWIAQSGTESSSQWGWFPAAVFIIGALSMAVIQMARDIFPFRRLFQGEWVYEWIEEHADKIDKVFAKQLGAPEVKKEAYTAEGVEQDLLRMATSNTSRNFYNLPIDQLCGQLNAALRAALENPKEHGPLITVFASTAADADLTTFLSPPSSLRVTDENRTELEAYAGARNRVSHHVERSIDNLQIEMGAKWKLMLQVTAIFLSLAIAFAGVGVYRPMGWNSWGIWDRVAIGLLAGYVAPVLRDILTRLQQGSH